MKNNLALLTVFVVFFYSCEKKSDFENENITFNYLFNVYAEEFKADTEITNELINLKKSLLTSSKNDTLRRIDSLIISYYNYLDNIDLKSENNKENVFYNKDILQKEGELFKNISEEFFENAKNK